MSKAERKKVKTKNSKGEAAAPPSATKNEREQAAKRPNEDERIPKIPKKRVGGGETGGQLH